MADQPRHPALIAGWLTPVYDLFARLFMPEAKLKGELLAGARLAPGHRLLDVGAGTGTLAIMVKHAQPEVRVNGLDSDPAILAIARRKAARTAVSLSLVVGSASCMPHAEQSFDRVVSSLVFSLLSTDDKRHALREAYRVLRSGGELHMADFGPPQTRWGRWVAPLVLRFEPITHNLAGLLPSMLREAGFDQVVATPRLSTLFGTLWIVSGKKPE